MKKGFTLLEVLVVVLIIGTLSAIALPQYRVAVKKAELATYMPIVQSLWQAEQAFFDENATFTDDLEALAISIPHDAQCTYTRTANTSASYSCIKGNKTSSYGVYDNLTNVQAGTNTIRYLQLLTDTEEGKKGQRMCFADENIDPATVKACRSLGNVTELASNSSWTHRFLID